MTLEKTARTCGLAVNEDKTKYMKIGNTCINRENIEIKGGDSKTYCFETVKKFNNLGVQIGAGKDEYEEVRYRITKRCRRI